jgi:TatD DNase family protein
MLDAHCHLDLYPDPSRTARDAENAGIFVICVTNHPTAFLAAEPHTRKFRKVRLALGLHPLTVELHTEQELRRFKELVNKTSFIGEIGLDFSRDGQNARDKQLLSFGFVLRCLQNRPNFLTLHSRRAESAVIDVLDSEHPHPVVFHWYSGTLKNLDAAIDHGHFFSINPAMLFSKKGKAIVERIPTNRALTESDGPFVNISDRTIVPSDIQLVENTLAQIWATTPAVARNTVAENFRGLVKPLRYNSEGK